jgi:hypothetical protein
MFRWPPEKQTGEELVNRMNRKNKIMEKPMEAA